MKKKHYSCKFRYINLRDRHGVSKLYYTKTVGYVLWKVKGNIEEKTEYSINLHTTN